MTEEIADEFANLRQTRECNIIVVRSEQSGNKERGKYVLINTEGGGAVILASANLAMQTLREEKGEYCPSSRRLRQVML